MNAGKGRRKKRREVKIYEQIKMKSGKETFRRDSQPFDAFVLNEAKGKIDVLDEVNLELGIAIDLSLELFLRQQLDKGNQLHASGESGGQVVHLHILLTKICVYPVLESLRIRTDADRFVLKEKKEA